MISDRTATLLALLCAVVFPNIKAFSSNGKYLGWNGPYFSMSSEKDKSPSTITCPDRRKTCGDRQTCCFRPTILRYGCCRGKGPRARCCSSGMTCCFQHQICCPQDAGCCNAGHWCDLTTMQCVPFLQLRDRGYVSIPISKPGLVQLNPQEETLVEKIHSTTGQSQQTSPKEHTGLTGEY